MIAIVCKKGESSLTTTRKKRGRKPGAMQPIRDRKTISDVKNWLLTEKGAKYAFLFTLGINTGLRVSDLLRLKVKDVKHKSILYIKLKKTERTVEIPLNSFIREEIAAYIQFKKDEDYLFPSRMGVNRPLTRQMISLVLTEAAKALELDRINTHSMRKTFGYWHYKQFQDVRFLMKLFGHHSQSQTLDYIGITTEEMAEAMESFQLGND